MSKQKIALLSFAVILFAAISFMPKSVVDNEKEAIGKPVAEQKEELEETHLEISEQERAQLDSMKYAYRFNKEGDKDALLSEIIAFYVKRNRIDSAARFSEANLPKPANWQEKKKVGDLYFDAFTFAFKPAEAARWGKKTREYYEAVLKEQPDSLDLRVKMGLTLVSSEMPMRGILMIRDVLEKQPDNKKAIRSLGMLSIESKQFGKAIGRFERLLELNPNDLEAKYYLGVSQHELGREAEAMQTFEELRAQTTDGNILQAIDGYLGEEHKAHEPK